MHTFSAFPLPSVAASQVTRTLVTEPVVLAHLLERVDPAGAHVAGEPDEGGRAARERPPDVELMQAHLGGGEVKGGVV